MAKDAEAEKAEKEAAEAAAQAAEEAAAVGLIGDDEFDKERAMATILKQRESERKLKADLAEARKAEAELAAIKQAEEDAKKSAEEKLAESEAGRKALEVKLAAQTVRTDFLAQAAGHYDDLELAYLAAERAGALGTVKEDGSISEPNFDKLDEAFPGLGGEAPQPGRTGEAGIRSKGRTESVNTLFNRAVRSRI